MLRFFLSRGPMLANAAAVARPTGYTKRSKSDELESLPEAGVLRARRTERTHLYSLARRQALESLLGDLPPVRPEWVDVLTVARDLVLAERAVQRPGTLRAAIPVKARRALDTVEPALDHLRLDGPAAGLVGEELWGAVLELGRETLGEWAAGRPGGLPAGGGGRS